MSHNETAATIYIKPTNQNMTLNETKYTGAIVSAYWHIHMDITLLYSTYTHTMIDKALGAIFH